MGHFNCEPNNNVKIVDIKYFKTFYQHLIGVFLFLTALDREQRHLLLKFKHHSRRLITYLISVTLNTGFCF